MESTMAKFIFVISFVALLVASATLAEDKQKRSILDYITDKISGKRCNDENDCDANQCCVPRHIFGKRCKNLLEKGDYCGTGFIQATVDRIIRRCPCQSGLVCTNTGKIGLYKIYKCQ